MDQTNSTTTAVEILLEIDMEPSQSAQQFAAPSGKPDPVDVCHPLKGLEVPRKHFA